MSDVRIAGVGLHPFGRFDGMTGTAMGVVAVRAALDEAGIGIHDVQAAFCGTAYGGVAAGHRVVGSLAGTGIPIYDIEAGCASGGAALQLAAASIASGQHDRVLVFGIEKMPKGLIRSSYFAPWQEAAGLSPAPAYFALRAQRLLAEAGLGVEHLAQLVVKNRRHGVANPDAMFRKAVTVEEVLASRMICEPLTLYMLCSPNEGAAAAGTRPRRRRGDRRRHLAPFAPPGERPGRGFAVVRDRRHRHHPTNGTGRPRCLRIGRTRTRRRRRRRVPGHRCGTRTAGLVRARPVRPGRPGRPSRSVATRRSADVYRSIPRAGFCPRVSRSAPPPWDRSSNWFRQLRGTAGDRQVEGARVGLAHVIGRGANACVTILVG